MCTVPGHNAPLRRQHEVFRRGHVDAVDAHHVDIVAGDDVGGLLVDRRYRLHTVNAPEGLQRLVVQQRLASVVAGGRRHVDLCQAAHGLDALTVRLLIAQAHGDQHHDTHDAHRHRERRQGRAGLAPEQVRTAVVKKISRLHTFPSLLFPSWVSGFSPISGAPPSASKSSSKSSKAAVFSAPGPISPRL